MEDQGATIVWATAIPIFDFEYYDGSNIDLWNQPLTFNS